jgi:hypothetical protein
MGTKALGMAEKVLGTAQRIGVTTKEGLGEFAEFLKSTRIGYNVGAVGKNIDADTIESAWKLKRAGVSEGILTNMNKITPRQTKRSEKAVRIEYKDGRILDISESRVKEYIPNSHPNAPEGILQKRTFDDALPNTKGYKRAPTQEELKLLENL